MRKYQCFISSTYDDLKEERSKCIEAILEAGQIPAGMEYFESGRPQKEIIEEWIDQSDMVIFVIGGCYGTIDSTTGNGYLEDEYNYVMENNIPHFSLVLTNAYLAKRESKFLSENRNISSYERDENKKERHKNFLRKICGDESVSFVGQLLDIKLKVVENINVKIQSGMLKGGWVEYTENAFTDKLADNLGSIKSEVKEKLFFDLAKDRLVDKADKSDVQEISQTFCNVLKQYDNSLDRYITTMSRSIELILQDKHIKVKNTINILYQNAVGEGYTFRFNPWLYDGLESNSFDLFDVKYNGRNIEESCIKRGEIRNTSNPFYITNVARLEIPFDSQLQQHRIQYRTSYETDYDRYFHEYVFREFCHFFNLAVSMRDERTDKKDKEYMLRWGIFTPYQSHDFSSKNILTHEKDQLNFNVCNLMIPGNGYILTLNSAPIGIIRNNKKK